MYLQRQFIVLQSSHWTNWLEFFWWIHTSPAWKIEMTGLHLPLLTSLLNSSFPLLHSNTVVLHTAARHTRLHPLPIPPLPRHTAPPHLHIVPPGTVTFCDCGVFFHPVFMGRIWGPRPNDSRFIGLVKLTLSYERIPFLHLFLAISHQWNRSDTAWVCFPLFHIISLRSIILTPSHLHLIHSNSFTSQSGILAHIPCLLPHFPGIQPHLTCI